MVVMMVRRMILTVVAGCLGFVVVNNIVVLSLGREEPGNYEQG
jgi:hypothetical protein